MWKKISCHSYHRKGFIFILVKELQQIKRNNLLEQWAKGMNRESLNCLNPMKRRSTLFMLRDMEIKTVTKDCFSSLISRDEEAWHFTILAGPLGASTLPHC